MLVTGGGRSVAYSPDGRLVAIGSLTGALIAASNDGTIQLWSTTSNNLEASIATGTQPILSASCSAALGTIATATNLTRVWQTDPAQVAAGICRTLRTSVSAAVWGEYLYQVPYTPACA